eukprot:TRINITY_DN2154_c2_g4_i2.p1 TRINITY_DN2154_c2_g4~~TRINITY_DN2154_c2_g4_i2.p1  ORF type:complete len:181 (-),score=25.55 TRINITY_DN2154_c2_g4_i2:336-878(-)
MSYSSSDEEDEGVDAYRKGGYHAVRPGDPFAGGRYIAQRKLGWGHYSTVWLAFDTRSSDHLALMMELLGKIPRKIAIGGSRSKDLFDRHGDLKRIRRLKYWPLDRLLVEKYKFSETDACEFSEFLLPILDFAPEKRPTAAQCSQHPWLKSRSAKLNDGNNVEGLDKLESGMNQLQLKMPK